VNLLVDPPYVSMKHRASFPRRMDDPDRQNGQTDSWTNGRVSLSVCQFVS